MGANKEQLLVKKLGWYETLKEDVRVVCRDVLNWELINGEVTLSLAWQIVHEVNRQRSYSPDHPRWKYNSRVLPYSHPDRSWIGSMYDSGLNDTHIASALRHIFDELSREGL